MPHAPDWLRPSGVALCGGLAGLFSVWSTRARPPGSLTLADGRQVMQPMYVEPTPLWLYAMSACLGAALALIVGRAVVSLVRR
jgi:hypothetical protein